jgi:O-methyltransferase involved in polyketide biosynthesis
LILISVTGGATIRRHINRERTESMTITLPAFTPLEESLFLTLCCRALDNRSGQPILADTMADDIVRKLDYDYESLHIGTNLMLNATFRAKKLDEVVSRFLTRHSDAVGLDLGAGLDTRAVRLAPPSTVDWYDVDLPAVAVARERVIPDRPNAHAVGADVRDSEWLDALPTHRPAVIVADGLMGFLSRDEFVDLLNRLISHFPSGEMVFNSYTPFAIWAVHHSPGTKGVADLIKFPGFNDPHEPESWNPKLKLVEEILLSHDLAQVPSKLRWYYRLQQHSTSWSRKGTIILHYRF